MSMSPGAAATTESPFDGDSDSVYGSKDTVLDSMDESDHAESFSESSDPTHPPPSKMASEEGFALREWRRLNAVRLAEKEREEKVILQEIIQAADEFKSEFYSKRQTVIENRKASNREKEKQYLANQERFHAEAHKSYWKAIAELIPHEVATIEKKGKKDKDRQPTVSVIMGPKPGKPTDMSRMRRVLVKLKHNTPPHMNHKPSPMEADKDAKKEPAPVIMNASGKGGGTGTAASASPKVAVRKGSPSNPP